MKLFTLSRQLVAVAVLMAASLSCSDDDPVTPPVPTFDVMVAETTLGKVLTDAAGKTLYFYTKDVAGTSTCTGTCLDNWPIYTKDNFTLDPGLAKTDFGSITRADGKTQITYNGRPLYYYKSDAAKGDVKGENVGSRWFVAKTTYTMMYANAQLVGNDGKSYTGDYKEGVGETQYLVDAAGLTLYGFANDKNNKNKYTKADFSNDATWPIYYAEIKDLPSTLDKTLFSTIDVFGKKQLTYKGWPLYYFGPDAKVRGANKGISVPKPGIWPIVNKDTPVAPTE